MYRDIKEENPTAAELQDWVSRGVYPLKAFFNTSGQKYRDLQLKTRLPELSQEEQIALLASDGLLVKRPVLVGADLLLVGFREDEWKESLLK